MQYRPELGYKQMNILCHSQKRITARHGWINIALWEIPISDLDPVISYLDWSCSGSSNFQHAIACSHLSYVAGVTENVVKGKVNEINEENCKSSHR